MKKLSVLLSATFLAFTLVFSSVGTALFFGDDVQTAEAKSYKSGKKGFSNTPGSNNTNIQNKDTNTSNVNKTNNTNTTTKGGFSAGGFMKGMMVGGLAGLLFGSLFADMGLGMLGNILGFAINAFAIVVIIALCVKIFQMITRRKDKEVTENWRK
ncbi:Preprotein translocase subunit Tim44 OS=Ureibacillus acetophenoni OX=614649 GN=SAMN05877842_103122 PE=4 SV=1 [Ureibacillus acetophenoni]